MKTMNKWMWAVTLLFGLASCEMKDEILGKDPMTGDTGTLSLSVETGKVTPVCRNRKSHSWYY